MLFGMKMVLNADSPAFTSVGGFILPTKYAAWAELLLIHITVPNSSFRYTGVAAAATWRVFFRGREGAAGCCQNNGALTAARLPWLRCFRCGRTAVTCAASSLACYGDRCRRC